MSKPLRFSALVANLAALTLLAVGWLFFVPTRLGGQAVYVIVNGISMEPNFHSDDLVIMRRAEDYQPGDVVTYRDADMGAYVIHRIIGVEQERYILQGDNNSWIDGYHPSQDEILGKLWLYIPQGGALFQWLRSPLNLALTAALLGGVLMTNTWVQPSKRGKNAKRENAGSLSGGFELTLYLGGLAFLAFLALAIFAFVRPLTRPASSLKIQKSGVFFYSASAAPGIYDTEMVRSGEPIFPKLTCALNVGFVFNVMGSQLQGISGSQMLSAKISDEQSGWQRTLALNPEAPFSTDSYSTMATIDLCQVQALVDSVEQETGFRPATYTLAITPHVSFIGQANGQEFSDSFEASLIFKFDKVHFYLVSGGAAGSDPLKASAVSNLSSAASEANAFSLFGQEFQIFTLRVVGVVGLMLAAAALLALAAYGLNLSSQNPEIFIRMRYGALLMDVSPAGLENLGQPIEVASMDDLARLAERQNTVILHLAQEGSHSYLVQVNGLVYRHVLTRQAEPFRPAAQEPK
ncbi:MAG: hypothetical protein OHK0031_09030 [Anaerolineales bacterium]